MQIKSEDLKKATYSQTYPWYNKKKKFCCHVMWFFKVFFTYQGFKFLFFIGYVIFRIQFRRAFTPPIDGSDDFTDGEKTEMMFWVIANMIIFMFIVFKGLEFLRANERFSMQVKLVKKGLLDITPFGGFFVSWVIIYALVFILQGATLYDSEEEYKEVAPHIAFFIQSLRNAIGDWNAPEYKFWLKTESGE